MCGRFTLRKPLTELAKQFEFELDAAQVDTAPLFNIAPTQDIAAVRRQTPSGPRELAFFHWGLIPSWAKDPKIAASCINGRCESIGEKPAFRSAFRRRRCLVLADGFYEWKRVGKTRQPYLYEVDGGEAFALAGVWETWRGPGGEGPTLESCSLITTTANELAGEIHDRMPVILDAADYDRWLDPAVQDCEQLADLLRPFDAARMSARPVSTFVNNARNQGPQCVESPEGLLF